MSNQDAAFGLRPLRTSTSSQRQNRYRIASGYNTGIFQGDLVIVATTGTITRAPAGGTALILGVFNGCSYVDPNGNQIFSNYWPANATGTDIFANIIDDPSATFEIQADAAFPVADLFGNNQQPPVQCWHCGSSIRSLCNGYFTFPARQRARAGPQRSVRYGV